MKAYQRHTLRGMAAAVAHLQPNARRDFFGVGSKLTTSRKLVFDGVSGENAFFHIRTEEVGKRDVWHPTVNLCTGCVNCDCPGFRYHFAKLNPTINTAHPKKAGQFAYCKHVKKAIRHCVKHGTLAVTHRNASGHILAYGLTWNTPVEIDTVDFECHDTNNRAEADYLCYLAHACGFDSQVYDVPADVQEADNSAAFVVAVECTPVQLAEMVSVARQMFNTQETTLHTVAATRANTFNPADIIDTF